MGIKELFFEFKNELDRYDKEMLNAAETFWRDINKYSDELVFPTDLEEVIRASRTSKEIKRELLLKFYKFYEAKTGISVETDLQNKTIIDNPQLRQIAIIEYLQTHEVTTEEIADQFMMSSRRMSTLLNELEDGVPIMDSTISIQMNHVGRKKSMPVSNHPIILNMIMPEVVAMTVGLMDAAGREPLYEPQFRKIAKDIYRGLTPYGQGQIRKLLKDKGMLEFFADEVEIYERQISSSLITMLKTGCKGNIHIHGDDKDYIFAGCQVISYDDAKIHILTKDKKEKVFPVENVFVCEEFFEREFE